MRRCVLSGVLLLAAVSSSQGGPFAPIQPQGSPFAPIQGSYRPVTPEDDPRNSDFPPARTPTTVAPVQQPVPTATPFYPQQPQFNPIVQDNQITRPYAENIKREYSPFVRREFTAPDNRFRPPELKGTP